MNVKALTGSVIHAPHPANSSMPRCRRGGATEFVPADGKVTCKRCIAQMATLAQSPDDDGPKADTYMAEPGKPENGRAVRAPTGRVIHAAQEGTSTPLPFCLLAGRYRRAHTYEATALPINCKLCLNLARRVAERTESGPAPEMNDADRHTVDPRKAAALRAARARERNRPAPTNPAGSSAPLDTLNAKQWVITEERVYASGYARLTETVITPDRARLNRTLAERFGVPSWRILLATHPTAVHEFSRDGRRITWRFRRPTLAQQRAAFLGELHGLLRAHDWWAVVDAVTNRGMFLGDTAQWRKVCEWTAESMQAMPSKPMSEIAQEGYKQLVSAHANRKTEG
jgi:hypothetical protein